MTHGLLEQPPTVEALPPPVHAESCFDSTVSVCGAAIAEPEDDADPEVDCPLCCLSLEEELPCQPEELCHCTR